jgi:tRNA-specific 2-thiouridylase
VRLHRNAAAVDAVKLRYRAAPVACTLTGEEVLLDAPFSAPAPGQTAVLLAGDVVVGCATIAG